MRKIERKNYSNRFLKYYHFLLLMRDFKWFQVISSDFKWFQLISSDFKWFQVISSDVKWFQVISSDFKWFQVISRDFKWFHVTLFFKPTEHKSVSHFFIWKISLVFSCQIGNCSIFRKEKKIEKKMLRKKYDNIILNDNAISFKKIMNLSWALWEN